jgi:hypothetical protein
MWILEEKGEEGPRVIRKEITYVPGLYKIFDEILGKKNELRSSFLYVYIPFSQCC